MSTPTINSAPNSAVSQTPPAKTSVKAGLLDPKTEWQKAFTDRFVKDLKIAF